MPKLVNNEGIVQDNCVMLALEDSIENLQAVEQNQVLPTQTFVDLMASVAENDPGKDNKFKVWLSVDQSVDLIHAYLDKIEVIVLKIDNFMDGRFFSQARVLREQFDFSGDIRAYGNFIQDQLYYLSRCGVSSFVVPDDANIESLSASLEDFSESYQAACDEPQPLFRRRA